MSTKRFFVDLHGCAKNQVDAELIITIMHNMGWELTYEPDKADLIIINSCGFINSAKEESINAVIQAKNEYPNAKILLAGCLAERYGKTLVNNLDEADAIFGNGDISKLPIIISSLFDKGINKLLTPPQEGICLGSRIKILNFPRCVYIKLTEGCDNFCSFCAIPIIRGRLRSKSIKEVCLEIKEFLDKGFYEFNLIGQDLAAYQTGKNDKREVSSESGLCTLLKAISSIKGHFKIRLLYIHPDHFPQDILPVMVQDSRFLPYFDIPFQSGSDKIIKAMNRKGNSVEYLNLIETIKKAYSVKPNPYGEPVIRTTFLTGFPGEKEEDFKNTCEFLQNVKPLWSGGFIYSREEDTSSYFFKERVPKKVAQARLDILNSIQTSITVEKLDRFIGTKLKVLVEQLVPLSEQSGYEDKNEFCMAIGRSWFQAPEVDGAVVITFDKNKKDDDGFLIKEGSVVTVKITGRNDFDLVGHVN